MKVTASYEFTKGRIMRFGSMVGIIVGVITQSPFLLFGAFCWLAGAGDK